MKLCENCNNEHDGSYATGRFCSTKCSRGFSTKSKRKEINAKLSNANKGKGHANLIKECKNCLNTFEVFWIKRNQECCSRSCSQSMKWKDESYKKLMSTIASSNAIKKHADPNIKFGWTSRKKFDASYPEQIAERVIQQHKIKYEREYAVHPYFIDFALLDYMIAIEIDGKQHLLPERIISDAKKDKLLQESGWTVYRIKWPTDNIINEVTKILASIPFA